MPGATTSDSSVDAYEFSFRRFVELHFIAV